MKRKYLNKLGISLITLMSITSCVNLYEIEQGVGNGNIPNDSVKIVYSFSSTLKDGDVIKGYTYAQSDVTLDTKYYFSVLSTNPLIEGNYRENVLISFTKDDYLEKKKDDGTYDKINFELKVNVKNMFFVVTDVCYFVFHKENWEKTEITTYSSFELSCKVSENSITFSDREY